MFFFPAVCFNFPADLMRWEAVRVYFTSLNGKLHIWTGPPAIPRVFSGKIYTLFKMSHTILNKNNQVLCAQLEQGNWDSGPVSGWVIDSSFSFSSANHIKLHSREAELRQARFVPLFGPTGLSGASSHLSDQF